MPQAEQPELSYRCEHCIGGQGFKSQARLEEHLANVHALGLDEVRSPDGAHLYRPGESILSKLTASQQSYADALGTASDEARRAHLDALIPAPVKPTDLLYPEDPRARDDAQSPTVEPGAA